MRVVHVGEHEFEWCGLLGARHCHERCDFRGRMNGRVVCKSYCLGVAVPVSLAAGAENAQDVDQAAVAPFNQTLALWVVTGACDMCCHAQCEEFLGEFCSEQRAIVRLDHFGSAVTTSPMVVKDSGCFRCCVLVHGNDFNEFGKVVNHYLCVRLTKFIEGEFDMVDLDQLVGRGCFDWGQEVGLPPLMAFATLTLVASANVAHDISGEARPDKAGFDMFHCLFFAKMALVIVGVCQDFPAVGLRENN